MSAAASREPRVVVVGAGPTGMTAAALLARRGVRVALVEREAEVLPIPRAVHFDDEVMRIFDAAGFGPALAAISAPIDGMRLVDRDRSLLASFSRAGSGVHGFSRSNAFDQPELEAAMRAAIAERPEIDLHLGVSVEAVEPLCASGASLRVTLRDVRGGAWSTLHASAVLGCDGARSRTRTFVGGELEDLGFDASWLVVDVDTPGPLDIYPGCIQVADPDAPTTYFCGGGRRHRWEFMLRADETPAEATREASVRARLEPWIGPLAVTATLRRRAVYTFHALVARRWRRGRVFLLGDAAHQMPPFIGQGMGAGARDAANLAWKLVLVLEGRARESILDTYEEERRPHARAVIEQAVLLGRVMTSRLGGRFRAPVMRRLGRIEALHEHLHRRAFPSLERGTLVGLPGSRSEGGHIPRAPLEIDGRVTHIDDVLGNGFALVTRGARERAFAFPGRVLRVCTAADPQRGAAVDREGALTSWLAGMNADCALIRPDRVVLAAGASARAAGWVAMLACRGVAETAARPLV